MILNCDQLNDVMGTNTECCRGCHSDELESLAEIYYVGGDYSIGNMAAMVCCSLGMSDDDFLAALTERGWTVPTP